MSGGVKCQVLSGVWCCQVSGGVMCSVVKAARIWLGFEPDRTSQTVSGSARQLLDDEPIVQLGLCQVF